MPRSLSLTALQVNALTTSDDTILYNAQARDISLYGGTNLASLLTQLEINNVTGDCLTLRFNNDVNNYANFKMKSSGTFDVTINNGDKSFNIVNHNGSTFGLKLGGTLVTSTAAELNKLSGFTGNFNNLNYLTGITPGTATAGKALVTDSSNNLVGINDLSTQNLTVAGTLVTASATELNYTDITTAGTAQAAKALVVDVNRDISNIRNLSATNLTGTLQTASQPNITSVGTLGSLTVTNQISAGTLNATSILVDGVDITTSISGSDPTNGITPGTVSASKVLLVDSNKNLTGMGNLTSTGTISASTLTGTLSTASQPNVTTLAGVTSIGASSSTTLTGTLQTASQSNVTSVGTLSSLTSNGNVNIAEHDGSTKGLQLAGNLVTANANEINKLSGITATTTELNTVAGVTAGTVSASKALVVDGNKDLTGIRNITTTGSISGAIGVSATTLTGTLSTASQPNITSVGTLANLTVSNQISTGSLTVNGSDIITLIAANDSTSSVTPGTVSASKVLVVDANKDLTGMRNLTSTGTITATTLAGTLSTASQPNITSVGTLTSLTANTNVDVAQHNGTSQGLKLAGTLVTASAADLNTTTGVTAGTVSASKHLVVDSNKDITGLRNLTSTGTITATTLTGTLSAGAQTGVSEVGTLSGLTVNNNVNVAQHDGSTKGLQLAGTLVTAVATDINKLSGVTEGTVSASKVVIADTNKDLTGIRNLTTTGTISGVTTLTATTLTGTLSTGAQTGITGVGTLTSLTSNGDVNIAEHDGSTKGFKLAGTLVTAVASDLNKISNVTASAADLNTTTGVVAGTVTASKHLVVDSNKDITGMGNLTSTGTISATTLTGTLSTSSQPNVTTLAGVTSIGASSSTTLTGTLQTASQPNVTTLAGVTSIGASSATTVTGTLQTASQPNVTSMSGLTSVGTLSSLALSGGISGATTINSSGIITNTNTTDSTSSTTGALVLSGGIGINDTADASSSTNGGSLTTAGGAAIAKKLFVGSDLTVGGNLTISGVTTTINSTTTTITDNTVLLNSGPAGTGYDSGVLTQRYQIDNSAGTGDVVNDTAKESYAISSGTTSTITLPSGANANNNYYNNWWIKITSGTLNNNVRKITAYNGTTKVATLSTVLSSSPSANDNVNLYNKAFTSLLWNESNKRFVSAFTSNDTSTPGALTIIDNADFQANNITGTLLTAAQPNITSVGTLTSLTMSGAISTSGNIITTGTGTITSAGLLTASAGISISNTTASTSSTTGALQVAGGAYFGAASVFNGNITSNSLISTTKAGQGFRHIEGGISLVSNIDSTTNSRAFFGTSSNNSLNLMTNNLTRLRLNDFGIEILSTNASTSSSTGALQVAGGAYFGAASLFAGALGVTGATTLSSTLDVTGATTLSSTLGVTGATTLSSNLTLTGASATLSLSGASSIITLSNTTASTSSTTGALQVAGGAYFGAASLFAGALGVTGATTLSSTLGVTGATTLSSDLTLNGASATLSISGASAKLTISNTTASTSSSTGALQVAGGAYFGAASLFAGALGVTGATTLSSTLDVTGATTLSSNLTLTGASSTLSLSGASSIITLSNTTASTSSSTGALQVAGGAYFGAASLFAGNLTSNGNISTTGTGTITSAGLLTASGGTTTQISDTGIATLVYPLTIAHLLSSGTPTANSFRIGMKFDGPNSGNATISYARIYSTCQSSTFNLHQGSLTLSTVFGGNFIDVVTISSSSATSSTLTLNGSLNVGTVGTSDNRINFSGLTLDAGTNHTVIAERIYETSSEKSELLLFKGNDPATPTGPDRIRMRASEFRFQTYTTAEDYSGMSDNNNRLIISNSGDISISSTTASTSSSTGALQVAGGAYFGANSLMAANLTLNGTSSTLSLSGASSIITLSNTTASTSSSTGALQVAGGAYFGANSLFNGNLTSNGQIITTRQGQGFSHNDGTVNLVSFVNNSTLPGNAYFGTSTDHTLILQTNNTSRITISNTGATTLSGNLTNNATIIAGNAALSAASWTTSGIQFRTSATTYTNTTAGAAASAVFNSFARPTLAASSALTTTNAATVYIDNSPAAGTNQTITNAYALWVNSGNSLFGGALNLSTKNTGNITTTLPTSYVSLNDNPIYMRSNDKNHYIGYCGNFNQTTWNTGKGFGNPTTANDGTVICGNANVIIGTLPGGVETICGNFTSTGLALGGGVPSYRLDCGSTASNMTINLWGGFFGIGACNSNLQSFSDGGFTWHTVDAAVTGSGSAPGTNLMTLNSSGQLGIGTSPTYPLHVAGTGSSYTGGFAFYSFSGSATSTGVASNPTNVMIYSSDRVMGSQFNAFSDSRIKKNIFDVDDLSALNTLRLIQPKKYNYIDTRTKTTEPVWGFIAQQVRSVLEHSTTLIKDFIPNIFQLATKSVNENNEYILTVPNPITFDSNGTGKIKLISENDKIVFITIKNKLSTTQILINEELEENNYFMYGEEVDNFHSLNKDAIFTITTAAVQEIDRTQIEQQNEINELKQKNIDLETRLARLEAFINTLEITE